MKIDGRKLYAKFKKKGGSPPSGYMISTERERVTSWESKAKEKKSIAEQNHEQPKMIDNFELLTKDFVSSINRFYRTLPSVMATLLEVEKTHINKIYTLFASDASCTNKDDSYEFYEIDYNYSKRINGLAFAVDQASVAQEILPNVIIIGIISAYDAFVAKLLKVVFISKPEMLSSSEKNISFKDLFEIGNVEEARTRMIEKEIETVLRMSHHEQFDWLEKKLDIPLRKDLLVWPSFVELCERRNLLTHTNGIVSQQYINVCLKHKVDIKDIKIGSKLEINSSYF